jgi:hypothetical protein
MSLQGERALHAWGLAFGLALLSAHPLAAQTGGRDLCLDASGPLLLVNEAPLRQPFLRALPQSACPAAAPQVSVRLHAANQYVDLHDRSRSAFLDEETYRLDLAAAYPLGSTREIRLEVPLRARSGGFMDGLIETWHDLLGLPQDTRREHPRNKVQLEIADSAAQRPLIDLTGSATGLGDVTVRFLQRVTGSSRSAALALVAGVKLPTGSSEELFGSGALDAGLGLAASLRLVPALWVHADLGVALLGDSPLADRGLEQSGTTSQALLALEWRPWTTTRFLTQLQSESTPLEAGLGNMDRRSLLLAWGVRQAVSGSVEAELALGEDLRVQTAPDFTVQTTLRWTPR